MATTAAWLVIGFMAFLWLLLPLIYLNHLLLDNGPR